MPDRSNPSCPICKRELPQGAATKTHPFCSARCKTVDLGNWLGDGYVIPGASLDHADDILDLIDDETLAALQREPS